MWRSLAVAALIVVAPSCSGDHLVATPTGTPEGDGDSGAPDAEGWGDPTTTRRPGILRIAQLNVRRYFDTTCESDTCATGSFEELATAAEFADKTAALASGLERLEADVITLAEVETQGCLDALQAKLKKAGFEYPVAHVAETGTPGSVDVAVLARGKLVSVTNHRADNPLKRADGSKTTFTRELPEVHLKIGSNAVVVFAAHFRSKAEDDPGRRLAEGEKTQELMVAAGTANSTALVLLGGDLNDIPGSPPIAALEKDGALVRVAKDIATAAQGTFTFGGVSQAIDHIFTTSSRATAYVKKSATVVRDGSGGFAGSDHATIYADFTLP